MTGPNNKKAKNGADLPDSDKTRDIIIPENLVDENSEVKKFYHYRPPKSLGWKEILYRTILDEQEITDQIRTRATELGLELDEFCFRKHTVDDVLEQRIPSFYGWTPSYLLAENGFEFVESISLIQKNPYKIYRSHSRQISVPSEEFTGIDFDIKEKKDLIVSAFEHLALQPEENQFPFLKAPQVCIYETLRGWPAKWRNLEIWEIGRYYTDKTRLRQQIAAKKRDLF